MDKKSKEGRIYGIGRNINHIIREGDIHLFMASGSYFLSSQATIIRPTSRVLRDER